MERDKIVKDENSSIDTQSAQNNKEKIKRILNKIPYKNKKFWFIVGGVFFVCLLAGVISYIVSPKYDYEKIDVKGKTIGEACEIVKQHGWIVDGVLGGNDATDCYNEKYIARGANYNEKTKKVAILYTLPQIEDEEIIGLSANDACKKLKEAGWRVEIRQNVPGNYEIIGSCGGVESKVEGTTYEEDSLRVKLFVASTGQQRETKTETETETETETGAESKPQAQSSSSSSSEWKQLLKDYEAWVDKYIAFMKKYKNASASDLASMMSDYSSLMSDMATWSEKTKNMQNKLSGSDLTEYISTLSRITQKLSSI